MGTGWKRVIRGKSRVLFVRTPYNILLRTIYYYIIMPVQGTGYVGTMYVVGSLRSHPSSLFDNGKVWSTIK